MSHLTDEQIMRLADGDADDAARTHAAACPRCRAAVLRQAALLQALAEQIGRRLDCLPVERVADLSGTATPSAGERAHLSACPLCRLEIDAVREGAALAAAPSAAPAAAPGLSAWLDAAARKLADAFRAPAPVFAAAGAVIGIAPGQVTRGEAHGLAVEVDATGPAVIVRLSAAPPGPLQLVLRSPNLTRRLTMAGTTLTLPPGNWQRLEVE